MKYILFFLASTVIFSCTSKKSPFETYIDMGYTKTNLNDHKGAYEDYSMAIEYEPKNPMGYQLRGCAAMQLNRNSEACDDFKKYLELGGEPSGVNSFMMIIGCK